MIHIPDTKYKHYPNIKDKYGHTVCYYLFNKGL